MRTIVFAIAATMSMANAGAGTCPGVELLAKRYGIHSATHKAWILRTGGFVGVRQWYGPVDAGDAGLENFQAVAERIEEPPQNS